MNLKKIKKLLVCVMGTVVLSCMFTFPAFATAYIQTWHLVDSGKHLDYDGNSKYMSHVDTGASIWNGYKSGVIRKDSLFVIQDVYISDINKANGATGITYSNGKIELNTYYFDNCTSSQKTNTATHELGHALGLDHSPSSNDIMYTSQTSNTILSQNDKDSYDASYARY